MSMRSIQQSIAEVNSEKVIATSHASTATTYVFDLSAVSDPTASDGGKLVGADGREQPRLVLQGDQDFYYAFTTNGSLTLTAATGVLVKAGDQEYVRPLAQTGRKYLAVLRVSADGTVKVFKAASAS